MKILNRLLASNILLFVSAILAFWFFIAFFIIILSPFCYYLKWLITGKGFKFFDFCFKALYVPLILFDKTKISDYVKKL